MSTVIDEVALEDSLEIDPSLLAAFLRAEREAPIVLTLDIRQRTLYAKLVV